jgi:Tfp pilus assembly protein PilX
MNWIETHNDGPSAKDDRDRGSALIMALVLMIVGSMMVLPVMNYTMTVLRSNGTLSERSNRVEKVKAGLRAALDDPAALYAACFTTGATTAAQLAAPPDLGIESECTTTKVGTVAKPDEQRYALATTLVGSGTTIQIRTVPDPSPYPSQPELAGTISEEWCTSLSSLPQQACGRPYRDSGAADPVAWQADMTSTSTQGKIYHPYLPPFANTTPSPSGYPMPPGEFGEQCTVFFPGRYPDAVVITGTTPVYFVSGIYYFEKTVRFSGDATVVMGAGAAPGCADSDAVALADAIGAPFDAYSSGVGATFVFGKTGRLMIDTATAPTAGGVNVRFNRRLVDKDDPLAELNDVSIMSVNGVTVGTAPTFSTVDLVYDFDANADLIPDAILRVPATPVYTGSGAGNDPAGHKYSASILLPIAVTPVDVATPCAPPAVPENVLPAAGCPIIDINLTTGAKVDLKIPGYVSVPQGSISIFTAPGMGVDKKISFGGGILAAQMSVSADVPDHLQIGLLNSVVQKTFKIVTRTTSGTPSVVSTALVQVNETGGYAVNSWVVQTGTG